MLTINVAKRQINIPVWNFLLISMEIFPIFFFYLPLSVPNVIRKTEIFLLYPPSYFPEAFLPNWRLFLNLNPWKWLKVPIWRKTHVISAQRKRDVNQGWTTLTLRYLNVRFFLLALSLRVHVVRIVVTILQGFVCSLL